MVSHGFDQYEKERLMSYEIELKDVEPQPVLSIKTKCKIAEIGPIIKQILPEVFNYLDKRGVHPSGPPFTRYHGFADDEVELEGGFPVAEPQQGEGRVEAGKLPGGTVARTMHVGPYEDLPKVHDALDRWIEEMGKEPAGPQWERYWTDPGKEPDPAKQETELLWPVK
jgi:effector-binding domain-containing protein